uniref:Thioredoxin related transmembrane protein 1 n=1 Tax=Gallus gallus TaxID=9031 RepID=A0A8V0Z9Z9_CHICK
MGKCPFLSRCPSFSLCRTLIHTSLCLMTTSHDKDGVLRKYQGARMKTGFINFIKDQEWKSTEPVSSWFHPSFYLLSSMPALFQMSVWIRHCHGYLTESIGMQVWGSYAMFLLATLFSGLILQLIMVFLADCLCASKKHRPAQYPYSSRSEKNEPCRGLLAPGGKLFGLVLCWSSER